jgi:hypothetical protein
LDPARTCRKQWDKSDFACANQPCHEIAELRENVDLTAGQRELHSFGTSIG